MIDALLGRRADGGLTRWLKKPGIVALCYMLSNTAKALNISGVYDKEVATACVSGTGMRMCTLDNMPTNRSMISERHSFGPTSGDDLEIIGLYMVASDPL